MKSLFYTIVEPYEGKRYNNTFTTSKGEEFILSTDISVDDFMFTNRIGVVKELPKYKVPYNIGDLIVVHTNVFRRFYNVRGELKDGGSHFREGQYGCTEDQVFAYNSGDGWKATDESCFVSPVEKPSSTFAFNDDKYQESVGVLEMNNEILKEQGLKVGDKVGFQRGSEFAFEIDGKVMYRMKPYRIICKYEE